MIIIEGAAVLNVIWSKLEEQKSSMVWDYDVVWFTWNGFVCHILTFLGPNDHTMSSDPPPLMIG